MRRRPSLGHARTFVLVHGAWHGGWCYARVAEKLRAQGHRVFTPTLSGLGERSHLASVTPINCSTHIQDIVNVIRWEQLQDVVLCGHSYGGMVIGGVADALPYSVASLVYLDAIVPQNDTCAMEGALPEQVAELVGSTGRHCGQFVPPLPAKSLNVNAEDAPLVDALCTPQPLATFLERISLTGAHQAVRKKTFVLATNWPGSATYQRMHEQVSRDASWVVREVAAGHDVMLDAPDRLVDLLLEAR